MSSIDQQFVEFIVKSLVGNPDAVQIERRIDEKGVLLELTVDPEDLGRVIGKRGATAQSLRTLLRALGTKNDARYNLKIVDNGEPRERRPREDDRQDGENHQSNYDDHSESASDPSEPNDELSPVDAVAVEPEEEVTETNEPEPQEEDTDDDGEEAERNHSDVISKTREELKEYDDLDV